MGVQVRAHGKKIFSMTQGGYELAKVEDKSALALASILNLLKDGNPLHSKK